MKIPEIVLSEAAAKRLADRIAEMDEEAKSFHSNWEQLHDSYMRQYRTVPDYAERKWPGGGLRSNFFVPLTRTIIDGYMAQEWDAMFSNDPFIGVRPVESGDVREAAFLEDFYTWVYREIIPFRNVANDYLFDNCLDGIAAVKPRWERDLSLGRRQFIEAKARTEKRKEVVLGVEVESEIVTGIDNEWTEEVRLQRLERPVLDNVDMTRLYVAPDTQDSLEWPKCRWYFQEQQLTRDDLLARKRAGYAGIDDALLARLGARDLSLRERTNRRAEQLAEGEVLDTARVLEVYMRWPLPAEYINEEGKRQRQSGEVTPLLDDDEQSFWEEIVVTYLADTAKISRVVPLARFRSDGKRPPLENRFVRVPRFFYGMGLADKMRQLNRWMNSNVNQMMDFGTIQNLPWFFYNPMSTGLLPEGIGLTPGKGIPVNDPRGVVFPRFQGDHQFWLAAMNIIQVWAERDGGINDVNQGRNPQLPQAQRTARGMAMMLQQGNIAFSRAVSMHKEPFEEIFRRVHQLYVRYGPDEIPFRITGSDGKTFRSARMSRDLLRQEMDFEFKLNPNRQSERQAKMELYQIVIQALPMAAQMPQLARPIREAAKLLHESYGEKNFAEIWPEELIPAVGGAMPMPMGGNGAAAQPFQGMADLLQATTKPYDEETASASIPA